MKRKIIVFMLLPLLTLSCNKKSTSNETKKEENYYSLKITTNNPEATNYSVNVDNLNRIKEGTKVTISNTPGYYKIIQFLSSENELLSSDNTYSFEMNSNKEIKLNMGESQKYLIESKGTIKKNKLANIILMAGQSNMCGTDDAPYNTNTITKEVRDSYRVGHDNVRINYNGLIHNNFSYNQFACGRFGVVDYGQGAETKYSGPEMGLSKYLGTNDPTNMYYLIKVAWGGSTILRWTPSYTGANPCWDKITRCVDNCITNLKSSGLIPIINGMCWFQGESDSHSEENASKYTERFVQFKSALLSRYNGYISNNFKWVSAAISDTYWQYPDLINSQLQANSDEFIEETKTLPKITEAHYTMASYLKIGELFGEKILKHY